MRSHGSEASTAGLVRHTSLSTLVLALILATGPAGCRRALVDSGPIESVPRAPSPKLVSLPTSDGGLIYGHEYGKADHGVVLAHGGRFSKESWDSQARVLAQAEFRVLAIDFRGYGQSRGGGQSQGHDERHYLDILAAVRYLRESGAGTVSVVGASFGGEAAARAAVEAEPGEIDRLVLLAHTPIAQPERMKGRKLFITTRGDFSGSGTLRLPGIRDQYERTPEPKELLILEGTAHAQHVFHTDQADRLMHEIQRFLSEP